MNRYYLIDHKLLFLFGYFFYLFTPYIVGINGAFEGYPGMELFQGFFRLIPPNKLTLYLVITFSWLPAFFLGHFFFKLFRPYKRSLQLFPATQVSYGVDYIGIGLLLVLLLFAFIARGSLFHSYQTYDTGARGKMASLIVIFCFFLLYQLLSKQKVSMLLTGGTILTALLLLSMGGRMYALHAFIIYLVYKTSFSPRRWKAYQILGVMALAFLVGSSVGISRLGSSFSFDKALYSFLAEPVFTWFSTSTYLIFNDVPPFNLPLNFLTSFLNLIPNTIVSLKPYMVSTYSMVQGYQTPLGADSVWSTYVINFGYIGSFIFIFITGFLLSFLRHLSENSRFWATYYILVCGMLPFQFFRDGFYLVNKQLFFNFMLLPALLLVLLKTVFYLHASYEQNRRPGIQPLTQDRE